MGYFRLTFYYPVSDSFKDWNRLPLNPQNIGNTAWAYAKLGHAAPALFDTLASVAQQKASDFNPQNIGNTVWAYKILGLTPPRCFLAATAKPCRSRADG